MLASDKTVIARPAARRPRLNQTTTHRPRLLPKHNTNTTSPVHLHTTDLGRVTKKRALMRDIDPRVADNPGYGFTAADTLSSAAQPAKSTYGYITAPYSVLPPFPLTSRPTHNPFITGPIPTTTTDNTTTTHAHKLKKPSFTPKDLLPFLPPSPTKQPQSRGAGRLVAKAASCRYSEALGRQGTRKYRTKLRGGNQSRKMADEKEDAESGEEDTMVGIELSSAFRISPSKPAAMEWEPESDDNMDFDSDA
ncbi:hypothetical protein HDV00_007617 [Rhizophlyctis rosea]|nr:hypothetical protein HDV00_007617 [Rhizophlyctis rosea]